MTNPTTAMRAAREALEKIAEPISSRRNDAEWLLMVIDLRRRIAMDALVQLDAALAQPSEEARRPLTDAQIEKLRENTFSVNNPFCPVDSKSMRKAVRAAEHAHGISLQAKDGAR